MAVSFAIRNYSLTGNLATFTLQALNADGSIDTGYVGSFFINGFYVSYSGDTTFSAADQGQRVLTIELADTSINSGLNVTVTPAGQGATLFIANPTFSGTVNAPYSGGNMLVGGGGNNIFNGNVGNDQFLLQQGGDDTANGGGGDDGFYFGGAYTSADTVNGGGGNDQLALQGDYSAGTTIGSLNGVEMIVLMAGNDNRFGGGPGTLFSYDLAAGNGITATNNLLTVQANTLRAGENVTFDGSGTAIGYRIFAGFGNDVLTGGSGGDGFFFGQGRFGSGDIVNGGGGIDQIAFQGDYGGFNNIIFGADQLVGVEYLVVLSAADNRFGAGGGTASYDFIMNDGNAAAGQTMVISANTLQAGETFRFQGQAETDGRFAIYSGAGDDYLVGGQGADEIRGGAGNDGIIGSGGADILFGGDGFNSFIYFGPNDSTALARDHIRDFKDGDLINFNPIMSSTSGGNFAFIGSGPQTGARQVQVIQNGSNAVVNLFLDGDAVADLVIDVTVADGHALNRFDFLGVAWAMEPVSKGDLSAMPDMREGLRFEQRFDHLDLGIAPTHDLIV